MLKDDEGMSDAPGPIAAGEFVLALHGAQSGPALALHNAAPGAILATLRPDHGGQPMTIAFANIEDLRQFIEAHSPRQVLAPAGIAIERSLLDVMQRHGASIH